MELPTYSDKPYRVALVEALRVRRGDETGEFVREHFFREVETYLGGSPKLETIKAYYKKNARLKPTPAVMEAEASLLTLPAGGAYFREYRIWQVEQVLETYAEEVLEPIYKIAMRVSQDRADKLPEA